MRRPGRSAADRKPPIERAMCAGPMIRRNVAGSLCARPADTRQDNSRTHMTDACYTERATQTSQSRVPSATIETSVAVTARPLMQLRALIERLMPLPHAPSSIADNHRQRYPNSFAALYREPRPGLARARNHHWLLLCPLTDHCPLDLFIGFLRFTLLSIAITRN